MKRRYIALMICGLAMVSMPFAPALAQAQKAKTPPPPSAPVSRAAAAKQPLIPAPGPAEKPLIGAYEFSDSRSKLDFTVPAGWRALEVQQKDKNADSSLIVVDGPGMPSSNCRVAVRKPRQPDKITQAQINKLMHDKRNMDMIAKTLSANGRKLLSISKSTVDGTNGLSARVLVEGNARRPDITILVSFFEVPGHAYSFECSVLNADLENTVPAVEALIKSARFAKS